MMVARIIEDERHLSSGMAAERAKIPKKKKEGLGIELLAPVEHEFTIPKAHRSKVADALSSRMMIDHRVFRLRWNPHATP